MNNINHKGIIDKFENIEKKISFKIKTIIL